MVTRRALVVGIAAVAGCRTPTRTGTPNGTTDDGRTPPTTGGTGARADAGAPTDTRIDGSRATATAGPATSTRTTRASLDLREANVTAVEWSGEPGGDVRFDVTLHHDDDGEDGYADWWQVETPGGDRLGRRELLHAHGTREFTRSATVAVPGDAACVVIRGHDRTHGYGGQVALATLDAGATRLVRQGPEPSSFSAADCP